MSPFSRRSLIIGSFGLTVLGRAAPGRLKIVVTGGHPGDPEYGCGGTIARYTSAGHAATLLYLNRGQKGCHSRSPHDCGALRTSEAASACRILKAEPQFSVFVDGEAEVNGPSYDQFRKLLQADQPDVVFTHWPVDNHRDHRAMSMLVYDAWVTMKRGFALYYYEVSDGEDTEMFTPTDYVDISSVAEQKKAACFAHASQSPERFYALQQQVTRFRGLERGCAEAEAFIRVSKQGTNLLP
jgi:LmbE family N-acetylglucosaminyl deacetylase